MPYLYHLTVVPPSGVAHCVSGSFSGAQTSEVITSCGSNLSLYTPDPATGMLTLQTTHAAFAHITSLATFRVTGGEVDYLLVGSDAGTFSVLAYEASPSGGAFVRTHAEPHSRSGLRREGAGAYVAGEARGRAAMSAALQGTKYVYVLSRKGEDLAISSPVDASLDGNIVLDLAGLDNGYHNPLWGALEAQLLGLDGGGGVVPGGEPDIGLVFYELDLGLNHIIRHDPIPVHKSSHRLIPVPGGEFGPSGVLVCVQGGVVWVGTGGSGRAEARFPLPCGDDLVTSFASHLQTDMFFVLVQTESGHLLRLSLEMTDDGRAVERIRVSYFDTIPRASHLAILSSGFLFATGLGHPPTLYEFLSLGETPDPNTEDDRGPIVVPEEKTHLYDIDVLPSQSPMMDFALAPPDLAAGRGDPVLVAGCGARPGGGRVGVLKHGVAATQLVASELPGTPLRVFSLQGEEEGAGTVYLLLSFPNATLVLGVGDSLSEAEDTGFATDVPTLAAGTLATGGYVQVTPGGVRVVEGPSGPSEWTPEVGATRITHAAVNGRQVVAALSDSRIVLFEVGMGGTLELTPGAELELGPADELSCLAVESLLPGRVRARFCAIGLFDNTVRVLSLHPDTMFTQRALQVLSTTPMSVDLTLLEPYSGWSGASLLHLVVGGANGVASHSYVDTGSGKISNSANRVVGGVPVATCVVPVSGIPMVYLGGNKSHVLYSQPGSPAESILLPLDMDPLVSVAGFESSSVGTGLVGVTGNELRIFTVDRVDQSFHMAESYVSGTPRAVVHDAETGLFFAACADARESLVMDEGELEGLAVTGDLGSRPSNPKVWASSCVVYDAQGKEVLFQTPVSPPGMDEPNEAVVGLGVVRFGGEEAGGRLFLVAGVVAGYSPPGVPERVLLRTYEVVIGEDGKSVGLSVLHDTDVGDVGGGGLPLAIVEFDGMVAVGVGTSLVLYKYGGPRLLRKSVKPGFPSQIVSLSGSEDGSRLIVADARDSIRGVSWDRGANALRVFIDDTVPRAMSRVHMIEPEIVVGGDRFGNVFVARVPEDADAGVEASFDLATGSWERGVLNGAPSKFEIVNMFYTGAPITSLTAAPLQAFSGSDAAIVYGTICGGMGVCVPFVTRDDVDFFMHLELHLRAHVGSLVDRQHLAWRSYYAPVKDVVDGDLCEVFMELDLPTQYVVAEAVECTPVEVVRRLEDMRGRNMF